MEGGIPGRQVVMHSPGSGGGGMQLGDGDSERGGRSKTREAVALAAGESRHLHYDGGRGGSIHSTVSLAW